MKRSTSGLRMGLKSGFFAASAIALLAGQSAYAGKYLMKLKDQNLMSFTFAQSGNQAFSILDMHEAGSLLKIDVNAKNEIQTIAKLLKRPDVEYIVEDFKLKAFTTPVEVNALREQWALAKVNAEKAWQLAGNKGKRSVLVSVIDTGVDYNHESLKMNSVPGFDYRDNDSDPMDITSAQNPGHGTHCAGIIGATGLVDGGIQGISPEVSIMPLRFLGADGSGDLMNGIKAIDYSIEKKADIISASWGAAVPAAQAKPLIDAVKRASDAGVLFVAAAANDGKNNDAVSMYPANAVFDNTITVAASGPQDEKPSWSNYGKANVAIAAPGLNIMSTLPKNSYGNLSGTSMATPLVAGLAALLKAQDPSLTGAQIKALMQSTGAKVAIETSCNCRIDAAAAMETLLAKKAYLVPAAGTLKVGETKQFALSNSNGNVTFTSSNPAAATIDNTGMLKAVAKGETVITATDMSSTVTSHTFFISDGTSQPPPGGGDCPLGDPALCEMLCGVMPDLPFCSK